jgi:HD-GYP domain-containing protein (c-di-GMP phosphodiesterase class II)
MVSWQLDLVALEDIRANGWCPRHCSGRILTVSQADVVERASWALMDDLRRHDPSTRGHSERVRALVEVIGVTLGLPDAEREKLRLAALLHDIGKLAVPRYLLTKRGALSSDEWELLRAHPGASKTLLAPLRPYLGEWLGAATQHHERFDGRGYPHALIGEEISLAGRIVAVADAYDCIVSVRSYKAAVAPDFAMAELAAGSGTHFDPEIVRAFTAGATGD